ncbi:unnamed protein product, partial [Ectocarpus fasciculatus]
GVPDLTLAHPKTAGLFDQQTTSRPRSRTRLVVVFSGRLAAKTWLNLPHLTGDKRLGLFCSSCELSLAYSGRSAAKTWLNLSLVSCDRRLGRFVHHAPRLFRVKVTSRPETRGL